VFLLVLLLRPPCCLPWGLPRFLPFLVALPLAPFLAPLARPLFSPLLFARPGLACPSPAVSVSSAASWLAFGSLVLKFFIQTLLLFLAVRFPVLFGSFFLRARTSPPLRVLAARLPLRSSGLIHRSSSTTARQNN